MSTFKFVTLECEAGTGGYNAFKVGEVLFGLNICLENICIFSFDNSNKINTFVTSECEAGIGGCNAFKVGEVLFGLKHL